MSARSSSTSTRPAQSRTQDTGGVSTVDAESMKYSMVSGVVTMWSFSSSVTLARPEPSRPIRHRAPVRVGLDQPGRGEVHHPLGLVDAQDLLHRPLS